MLLPLQDKHNNPAPTNGHTPGTALSIPTSTRPDTQVTPPPTRRRFTPQDKLRILAEAEACHQPGQLGQLLRREGLYSSSLASFRKQRDEGKLGKNPALIKQQRRDKEAARQRDARRIAQLQAENQRLLVLLELQKKVAEVIALSQQSLTSVSL